VKPDPDLNIIFAPYPTSNQHFALADERQSKEWREWYLKWLTLTKRFGMREYFFLNTIAPLSYSAKKDLMMLMEKQDAKNLIVASEIYDDVTQGEPKWDLAAMQEWIIVRLFWDPRQDVKTLRDRYIKRAYRDAAPYMTKYYDIVRDSWLDPKDKTTLNCHCGNNYIFENIIVKKGLEKKCLKTLKDAIAAAKNPKSKELIERKYKLLAGQGKALGKLIVDFVPEMKDDGMTFESVQWEKPSGMSQFRRLYLYKKPSLPKEDTEIKAAHDGENLYIRITAHDQNVAAIEAMKPGETEVFPQEDHIEFWIYTPAPTYLFAFNSSGAMYDSKNLDRKWNSGWKCETRKTKYGWEAILKIPVKSIGMKPGVKTRLRWGGIRLMKHKGGGVEQSSFKGVARHGRSYPIIMDW
jgi:hypothetical protein